MRLIGIIVLSAALVLLYKLPTAHETLSGFSDIDAEFNSLPDYDYITAAEMAWKNEQPGTAIALLEAHLAFFPEDRAAAMGLLSSYQEQIQKRKSGFGRITAFCKGTVTGKVNSLEELGGAVVADFFVIGDIRDLVVELGLEDDANEFIVAMSGLGLLTAFFPPADPALSLIKATAKAGALTTPMKSHLIRAANQAKVAASKGSSLGVSKAFEEVMPIFHIAKRSRSWDQFTTCMRQVDNVGHAKFMVKTMDNPGNARKLEQILATLKKPGEDAGKVFRHLYSGSQKGMDNLYAAMRKGPAGVKFVAKHPTFTVRALKNVEKTRVMGADKLFDWWQSQLLSNRAKAELLRIVAIVVIWTMLALMFLPTSWLSKGLSTFAVKDSVLWRAGFVVVIAAFIALFTLAPRWDGATTGVGTAPMGGTPPGVGPFGVVTILLLLLIFGLQFYAWRRAMRVLQEIRQDDSDNSVRLSKLANADIWFDLPLYCGLFGTVSSFLVMTIDPTASRTLAYSSTIVGIILSAVLRTHYLYPLKNELIEPSTGAEEVERE